MSADRHLVITGVTGYIGGRLLSAARDTGWWLTVLSRHEPAAAKRDRGVRWFAWSMEDPPPAEAFEEGAGFPAVDGVVHLAHLWQADAAAYEINLSGSRNLIQAVRDAGVRRFVFGSTISARQDAPHAYGRLKWKIEQSLEGAQEFSARIGLVYGGPQRSQWGTLCNIVNLLPVLPMVAADREVQPIHVDDLCRTLLKLVEMENPSGNVYGLADSKAVPFGHFLKMLAEKTFGKTLLILPIPLGFAMAAVKVVSALPFLPDVGKERILGLAGLPVIDNEKDMLEIGVPLRTLADGLSGEMRCRYAVAAEGRVLLTYLTGRKPTLGLLRRYVRGIEKMHNGRPITLPALVRCAPALLRIWEPLHSDEGKNDVLASRLRIALLLADATFPGGARAYDYEGDGKIKAAVNILWNGLVELTCIPLRLFFGRRKV